MSGKVTKKGNGRVPIKAFRVEIDPKCRKEDPPPEVINMIILMCLLTAVS